jgi:DNA-binding FrmR family transcriptional regulator
MPDINPNDMQKVIARLRRAQGQIDGVVRMIESGRDCKDIVTQVAAASKALDRAGFAIVSQATRQCLDDSLTDEERDSNLAALERLFLSLA